MNRHQSPLILTVVLLLVALPAQARDAETWAADYEQLMDWEFSTGTAALPAGGVRLKHDTAEWVFESGTVRPMRPTTDGSVTGLVFEGQGRFRMTIPDAVEANQVARFALTPAAAMRRTELPTTNTLEYTFGRMVLRTTDDRVMNLFPTGSGEPFKKNKTARQRHLWWLEHARFDADSRVIAGLLNGDNEYLAIDMETDEHGWLFYEFDAWRMEEIRLCRMRKSHDFVEVWVSLDRAEHRRSDGRPGSTRTPLIDQIHADLEVDLMKHKGRAGQEISRSKGYSREYPLTFFRAKMELQSEVEGLRAIPLRLIPFSTAVTVTDAAGNALPVLRDKIGKRFSLVHPKEEDTSLVVILKKPLARGEKTMLDFSWQRQTSNHSGRGPHSYHRSSGGQGSYRYWYPEPLEGRDDRHTARVTVIHPEKLDVRATGTPAGGRKDGKQRIGTWESSTPIKAAGWSYGYEFKERRILQDGLPEVVAFGANRIQKMGDTVEAAAAQMTDSIRFYQETFDYALPLKTVTGTQVSGEQQSMSGFIMYGSQTFNLTRTWDSEWSMAENTAELFWSQRLDWESYRDRWLAGALAGYSAMMYLEAITDYWDIRKRGSIKDYDELLRLRQRRLAYSNAIRYQRLGPLDVGFRVSVPEFRGRRPGMVVLHMLRGILRGQSENGARQFNAILADFLTSNLGKTVSTEEFIATVERHTGEDWGWFFQQWVYGTEVPTYTWSHGVTAEPAADGMYVLEIRMEQKDVSPGFRMPVTFGLEYKDAEPELLHFVLDQPSKVFTTRLPFNPLKVTFDPNYELYYFVE